MNLDINVLLNLACVIASICFFIAKLDAMTKANRQFYESTIANLHENISQKFAYLEGNITEKFRVVDERFANVTDHVNRLEIKQMESNKIKERLAIMEHTVRMLMNGNDLGKVLDSFNSTKSE
jgi:hypothetical protein